MDLTNSVKAVSSMLSSIKPTPMHTDSTPSALAHDYDVILKNMRDLGLQSSTDVSMELNSVVSMFPAIEKRSDCTFVDMQGPISFDLSAYENRSVEMEVEDEDEAGDGEINLNSTFTMKTLGKKGVSIMLAALQESEAEMLDVMSTAGEDMVTSHQEQYNQSQSLSFNVTHSITNSNSNIQNIQQNLVGNKCKLTHSNGTVPPLFKMCCDELQIPDSYENFLSNVSMDF